MPFVEANGIKIHYQSRGSGPNVVLVHGVTSSSAMWYNGILAGLAEQYRVTAYDLRGHGLTTLTPNGYSSHAMAEDLGALLDVLKIEDPLVVGHSFGGAIGMNLAVLRPDRLRGLVMLDSGFACLRYLRIIQDWAGWQKRPEDMAKSGLSLDQFLELDSEQDVTEILRHGLSVPRRAGFKKGESGMTERQRRLLDETRVGYEFRDVAGMTEERLAEVRVPALAVYGETSPYGKMALRLTELQENTWHDVLEGTGHFYAIHRPTLVLERIVPFLQDPVEYIRTKRLEKKELVANKEEVGI